MKRFFLLVLIPVLLILTLFYQVPKSSSDELDDITKQIQDLTKNLNESLKATQPLESELNNLKKQVAGIKSRISFIEADIENKEKSINDSYKNLEKQEKILNETVRDFYIKSYYNSPLYIFLSSSSVTDITNILTYQKVATDQDKAIITNIALSIVDLETKKTQLERERAQFASIKADLDVQSDKLDKIVSGAKSYQQTLSSQIAQLSSKQQSILSQRLGSLGIPRSAGTSVRGCTDDRDIDPGFSPRIAFFSYGAPHRNGLNQYGAFARAKEGQGEQKILEEYYPGKTLKTDYDQNIQIRTTTGWSGAIEDYVKRIYEVPNSWGDEGGMAALKAQAVAARTYALNVTGNGSKQICTSEQCQVFKPDPKGGNWDTAVEATRGWVLMDGASPAFTQYASTHGGYIQNLGKFDGRVGTPTNFAELNERAYDRESPWFYCDWGARPQYNKTAWLKSDEVADIVNVLLLVQKDSSIKEHLYQTDKPNPAGTDTWDEARVKQELQNRGGNPFSSVSSITVSADFSSGKTSTVSLSGDAGSVSFAASDFKNYFNIRAPANIQIVGPLFNIEKK
ncbi:MAG: SpoIID/LytB domain-containing protein [Patescibacteria group bacterium]